MFSEWFVKMLHLSWDSLELVPNFT